MVRQLLLEYAGTLHHVTACRNAQQAIYLDFTDCQQFLTVAQQFGVSPSRISHIQQLLERWLLTYRQTQVRKQYQVKQ